MIESEDTSSYSVIGGRADCGLVLLCDHATNLLPAEYGTLGLAPAQLERHIAYDIGALAVTEAIAAATGAPVIHTRFSRLLIDPNRGADDPTLIMRLSDGAIIPGNRHLDAAERARRIARFYRPYHDAIDRVIDSCIATGVPPALLSIHSFTESWKGVPRPWHVGILWDRDRRLSDPLLELFNADGGLIVGDNEPYSGKLEGDCLWQHGTRRDLANVIIEVRQDLIRDAVGQKDWGRRIVSVLAAMKSRADLRLGKLATPVPIEGARTPGIRPVEGGMAMKDSDEQARIELEAAAYRRLVEHLRTRTDVQNIDLMNLAGFCRNCLANWYQEAANAKGRSLTKDEAREIVYGMPYKEWQAKHQTEANAQQKAAFEKSKPKDH